MINTFTKKGLILHPTKGMSRAEWLQLRSSMSGLGGSDIGTLFGLNPWKSAIELFHEKVGFNTPQKLVSEAAFHGTNLEKYIRSCWEHWDGSVEGMMENFEKKKKIRRAKDLDAIAVNPDFPYLFANVDGIITKHPEEKGLGVLEIKCISHRVADMWELGIPPSYLYQVHHYALVLGLKYAEIASLKDGSFIDCLPIPISESIMEQIAERGEDFNGRVVQGIEAVNDIQNDHELLQCLSELAPDYGNSPDQLYDFYSKSYKNRLSNNVIEDPKPHLYLLAEESDNIQKQINALKEDQTIAKVAIQQELINKDATVVDFGKDENGKSKGKITWGKQFRITMPK